MALHIAEQRGTTGRLEAMGEHTAQWPGWNAQSDQARRGRQHSWVCMRFV